MFLSLIFIENERVKVRHVGPSDSAAGSKHTQHFAISRSLDRLALIRCSLRQCGKIIYYISFYIVSQIDVIVTGAEERERQRHLVGS